MSDRPPSMPRRSRQSMRPALLLLAVLAVLPVAAPAAPPDMPSAAEIDARVAAIQALPLPTEDVAIEDVATEDVPTEGSAASAILVERDAADLVLGGNQLVGRGRDGLIVDESSDVDILGNGIAESARSGIRVRASDGVRIEGNALEDNALEDNARTGLEAHDWSGASRAPNDEETPLIRPTGVTVGGNRFAGNEWDPCLFAGVAAVLLVGASDC